MLLFQNHSKDQRPMTYSDSENSDANYDILPKQRKRKQPSAEPEAFPLDSSSLDKVSVF